jgi:hypothetical protein
LIKIKKEFLKWIKVINIANLFDIATTIFWLIIGLTEKNPLEKIMWIYWFLTFKLIIVAIFSLYYIKKINMMNSEKIKNEIMVFKISSAILFGVWFWNISQILKHILYINIF